MTRFYRQYPDNPVLGRVDGRGSRPGGSRKRAVLRARVWTGESFVLDREPYLYRAGWSKSKAREGAMRRVEARHPEYTSIDWDYTPEVAS